MIRLKVQDRALVGHELDLRKLDAFEGQEVVVVPRTPLDDAEAAAEDYDEDDMYEAIMAMVEAAR